MTKAQLDLIVAALDEKSADLAFLKAEGQGECYETVIGVVSCGMPHDERSALYRSLQKCQQAVNDAQKALYRLYEAQPEATP